MAREQQGELKKSNQKADPYGGWENLGLSHQDLIVGENSESGFKRFKTAFLNARLGIKLRRGHFLVSSSLTLVLLLILVGILALNAFSTLRLPWFFSEPHALLLLAALVLFFAVRTYTDAVFTMGFTGRFIRPGLRRLLEYHGAEVSHGQKYFRGREIAVLKTDVADFTATTFEMPYGMRRLFIDLWFILMDQVVADKVFLDKSLGDGSVYYFESGLPGGSATTALQAAMCIRSQQIAEFDRTFTSFLEQRIAETPQLAVPAQRYFDRFLERNGYPFSQRRTRIRMALVAGWVDEGLWGMSSQSHYDAHGTLPILATRLEAEAGIGEIVCGEGFIRQLEMEHPGSVSELGFVEREVKLKGIGRRTMYVLPPEEEAL